MKRTVINLTLITLFLTAIAVGDLLFMNRYSKEMNERLDAVEDAQSYEEKQNASKLLCEYFQSKYFLAHRLVHTGRLDEVETLLHKLNAYIKTEDEHEVDATVAELRGRVDLLFNHWHQPRQFSIE